MSEWRCDTCRWWTRLDDGEQPKGVCDLISGEVTSCWDERAESVGEGAELITRADFGCLLWAQPEVTG